MRLFSQSPVGGPFYQRGFGVKGFILCVLRSAVRRMPSAVLVEIFDPWDFLTRIDTVFDRLEQLSFE